jgi:hypothetical protein
MRVPSFRTLLAGLACLTAVSLPACPYSDDSASTNVAEAGAGGTSGTSSGESGAAGSGGGDVSGVGGDGAPATGGSDVTTNPDSGAAGGADEGGATTDDSSTGPVTGGGIEGGGKAPMCITNDVAGGVNRATMNYIECDVEDQAIDFDVAANYSPPRKPGYDPSMTPVTFTNFGTAFSGYEVQQCHPYCYKGNLTIGIDATSGDGLKGEVLFDFPPNVAPITDAPGRPSLGWLFVDGPALPAGMVTAQMILKSKDKGILVAQETKKVTLKTWVEFRYFPIQQTFNVADLVNITSIGFRLTFPAEWHGVVYADHFQLRK